VLKKVELSGRFRILHNEELRDLYKMSGIVTIVEWKRLRWAEHVDRMKIWNAYRILLMKSLTRKPHGR